MERFAVSHKLPVPSENVPHIFKGGPATGVDWCFPLLPGILITNSWYQCGPLFGKGGVKLVLYYGVGSLEILALNGWIS